MAAMNAASFAGLLLAFAAATAQEEKPRVPTTERVVLLIDGWEVAGFLLDADPEQTGLVLVTTDGTLLTLPPNGARPPVKAKEQRAVTEIPSAPLVEGLGHRDAGVADRCKELLDGQGVDALPFLEAGLAAAAADARRRTLEILAGRPSKTLRSQVRACLDDPNDRVRQRALAAYAALEPDDLVARSIAALQRDRSPLVQHEAIVELGRARKPVAVDALIDFVSGCEDYGLRAISFDALRRITGRTFERDEAAWRAWWTNHRAEYLPNDGS